MSNANQVQVRSLKSQQQVSIQSFGYHPADAKLAEEGKALNGPAIVARVELYGSTARISFENYSSRFVDAATPVTVL